MRRLFAFVEVKTRNRDLTPTNIQHRSSPIGDHVRRNRFQSVNWASFSLSAESLLNAAR
jgi:hypothetical protein